MLLSEQTISRHLMFWFWLVNGNLITAAKSNNSLKTLEKISKLLKAEHEKTQNTILENDIYGLVQGSLLSYLVYNGHYTVAHFPAVSNIALLARTLLSDALQTHTQLSQKESLFGLYPRLLFQQAELEYVHFERQDVALNLLTKCHEKLTVQPPNKPLHSSVTSDSHPIPSFARVKQTSLSRLEADSVSDISSSFLSHVDTSALESDDINGPYYDSNLKEACKNAQTQLENSKINNA